VQKSTTTGSTSILEIQKPPTGFPEGDARAYLIERQRSLVRKPEKRYRHLRTDLLPLEMTPSGSETRALVLTLEADLLGLSRQLLAGATGAGPLDDYGGLEEWFECKRLDAVEGQVRVFLSRIGMEVQNIELKLPNQLAG
jgi:hypothetical protein